MDEEIDRLVIAVRADTQAFARDIGTMRRDLEGPLGDGAERAGRAIEATLARAIRTGKLGFEELKSVALSVLAEIAASAIRSGIGAILGRGGAGGGERGGGVGGGLGGLLALGNSVLGNGVPGNVRGLPGRATGGPVAPGRGYLVGERGPEVFVPTASGTIQTTGSSPPCDIRVSIAVAGPAGAAPDLLARSSRQVARAVRQALIDAGE